MLLGGRGESDGFCLYVGSSKCSVGGGAPPCFVAFRSSLASCRRSIPSRQVNDRHKSDGGLAPLSSSMTFSPTMRSVFIQCALIKCSSYSCLILQVNVFLCFYTYIFLAQQVLAIAPRTRRGIVSRVGLHKMRFAPNFHGVTVVHLQFV